MNIRPQSAARDRRRPGAADAGLVPLLLLPLLFLFASCGAPGGTNQPEAAPEEAELPKPRIDLDRPLEVSTRPEDVGLCRRIEGIIDESVHARARWGVIAISLGDGRVVCGLNAQNPFTPASVQKLLTSLVALDRLGPDHRWKTSLYAAGEVREGVVGSDLVLYGRGAPDLDDAQLKQLVGELKRRGVREIRGDIVGDESHFKGDNYGDGWTWNALQWYYGAASSALSLNRNQVRIVLRNGRPGTDSKFVELSGEVAPVEDIEAVGVKRELGTNKVYVWGNGRDLNARIAVNRPALFSARILKEMLAQNGIRVTGEARSRDWRSKDRLDPAKAFELASVESRPLAEIVRRMNLDSVNLYAELLLRTLGRRFGPEAPDEDPKMQKLRGDDAAGAAVVEKWLSEHGISTDDVAIHDGSGLSRLNNVTPETVGRALVFAAQSDFSEVFSSSLPVAGRSGTLRGRLGAAAGRIRGKTGSIRYVNTLAGYAARKEETLAFVVFGNNLTRGEDSGEVIDRIALELAGR